ncbi:MAG: DUF1611 domain-containing protein, partial [Gammaproteobacteria bacterium]|nr:DUF1611 domain-containing protein [Gammaproteobacteria bacterium]
WDIVEGQGSLFHPSFGGVSLALLHGTQPDAFVVCHEPTRNTMRNVARRMPKIEDVIAETVALGRLNNPAIRCVGIAINTAALDSSAAGRYVERARVQLNLPVCDPVRDGVGELVDALGPETG